MDNLQRASATLLILGDNLVPEEVTALLGIEPKLGVRKGEKFLTSRGSEAQAPTGKWIFGGEYRSPPNLDEQIVQLLSALPSDATIWPPLTSRFDCCLSVGAYFNDWTGGITLEPATLGLLSERTLPIDFDMYAPNAAN
jgi:uncharacterized protein DUF4279